MNTQPHAPHRTAAVARRTRKAMALLVLIMLLGYGNTFSKPFHMDDAWLFSASENSTHTDDDSLENPGPARALVEFVNVQRHRGLIMVTMHLNYRLHAFNVFGYHVVNVIIHFAAAWTLFALVRRTLLLPRWQGRFDHSAFWLAFPVALFWLMHPLQTNAVTYIIQRMESMMGLFYFLTLYCLLRAAQSPQAGEAIQTLPTAVQLRWLQRAWQLPPSWYWYLTGWVCCALGCCCKEVMVTLLPVLLAYDYVFLARWEGDRRWFVTAAILALGEILRRRWLFYLGIAAMAFWVAMPQLTREKITDASAGFNVPSLPHEKYWLTQVWVQLYYIRLSIIPYPQVFWYRDVWPDAETGQWATVWPAALHLGALGLLILWLLIRRHWIGFLGVWFFGVQAITTVVPLRDVIFEHRLYLPLAAPCCLVVIGGYLSLQAIFGPWRGIIVGVVFAFAITAALTVLTAKRNEDFRTDATIWASWDVLSKQKPDVLEMLYLCFTYRGQ